MSDTIVASSLVLGGWAQDVITGRVVNAVSGAPLEYVSVGSVPEVAYTMSDLDGNFRLCIPSDRSPDSVRFAMLGFGGITVSTRDLRASGIVRLQPNSYELPATEVVAEQLVERRLGNRSHHPFFNYLLEEQYAGHVLEVAQVIELGPVPVSIRAANFYISDTPMDSASFRIGFRAFDGERPTGPLVDRSIVRRVATPDGWLTLDLQEEHIRLKGTVVLTMELLPEHGPVKRWMSVGIRLGGGRPGFDRRGGFEGWTQMPHRYSLNVTARVPKHLPEELPEDPDPFQHAVDLRVPSTFVGDTFSIAFGLPERYDAARPGGYPTLYLLDANIYFSDILELCRHEARKGHLPPMLVVGIGYNNIGAADTLRDRDYTIAHTDSIRGSGGAGHFLSFLQNELCPLVRARYPTDTTHCAMAGHSLGGHLVLAALIQRELHGELPFTTFLAASPSVDVADGALLYALEGLASETPTDRRAVFISHGEGEDDAAMRRCTQLLRRCFRHGVVEQHYPGTDHMGTAMPSFKEGLRALWGEGK